MVVEDRVGHRIWVGEVRARLGWVMVGEDGVRDRSWVDGWGLGR